MACLISVIQEWLNVCKQPYRRSTRAMAKNIKMQFSSSSHIDIKKDILSDRLQKDVFFWSNGLPKEKAIFYVEDARLQT